MPLGDTTEPETPIVHDWSRAMLRLRTKSKRQFSPGLGARLILAPAVLLGAVVFAAPSVHADVGYPGGWDRDDHDDWDGDHHDWDRDHDKHDKKKVEIRVINRRTTIFRERERTERDDRFQDRRAYRTLAPVNGACNCEGTVAAVNRPYSVSGRYDEIPETTGAVGYAYGYGEAYTGGYAAVPGTAPYVPYAETGTGVAAYGGHQAGSGYGASSAQVVVTRRVVTGYGYSAPAYLAPTTAPTISATAPYEPYVDGGSVVGIRPPGVYRTGEGTVIVKPPIVIRRGYGAPYRHGW